MNEPNLTVAPSTIYRWLQKFTPKLEIAFRKRHKNTVGNRWRMNGTDIKIKSEWRHRYRTFDTAGKTVDLLLAANRDKKAALRFFKKAIGQHWSPDSVTTDNITIRQSKYPNNQVEQDHRAVKRIVRLTLGIKSFQSASTTLHGVEPLHMIKKGQL